jgi:uncharacterized protein YoxC
MLKVKGKNNKVQKKVFNKIPVLTFEEKIARGVGSIMSLYVHTFFFIISFLLIFIGVPADMILLILTTVVSLEAIYLAIFIQMSVNKNTKSLEEVEEDLDEIQVDLEEIAEDVDEIQEDIDEIEEDVDDIEDSDSKRDKAVNDKFTKIDNQLDLILEEIKNLRNK